jgi:S1-C subfamily serine protease
METGHHVGSHLRGAAKRGAEKVDSMVRLVAAGIVSLGFVACGADPAQLDVSQREATGAECANGGLVLVLDGEEQPAVCNGARGADGQDGVDGASGIPGRDGASGSRGLTGATGERGASGANGADPSAMVEAIANSAGAIVIVECTDGVITGYGSGTKTTTGTVITAEHVTNAMTTCSVYSEAPVTVLGAATFVSQRGARDQVELTVSWNATGEAVQGLIPHLNVAPSLGALVAVVGNPSLYDGSALEHQYTTGLVTATNLASTLSTVPLLAGKATSWESSWSTDAVAWHGNSGGPVFNAAGEWVGILVGAFNGGPDNEGPDLSIVLPLF